jgi:hypothetical protein
MNDDPEEFIEPEPDPEAEAAEADFVEPEPDYPLCDVCGDTHHVVTPDGETIECPAC